MDHDTIRRNMIAAEAWPEGITEDEKRLRILLANVYGCTYRDDGELQNSADHPLIDFKRDPVEKIGEAISTRNILKMAEGARVGRFPDLRIRKWARGHPACIVIDFIRDITNEEIEALPKALMAALADVPSNGRVPNNSIRPGHDAQEQRAVEPVAGRSTDGQPTSAPVVSHPDMVAAAWRVLDEYWHGPSEGYAAALASLKAAVEGVPPKTARQDEAMILHLRGLLREAYPFIEIGSRSIAKTSLLERMDRVLMDSAPKGRQQ